MSKYKIDKEELEKIVKEVLSTAEVCRRLEIRPAGGNYKTIKKYINLYDIDISHFTGQGWNTGLRYKPVNKITDISDILVENSTYTSTHHLKIRLIKEGLKDSKCELCNIESWCGKSEYRNEKYLNRSELEEVKKLKVKKLKIKNICSCGKQIKKASKKCNTCHTKSLRIKERPSIEQLEIDIKELGYCGTGRKYEVSDNSIRKWLKYASVVPVVF